MLRGLLLLALAVTTAACGTRQARTGETGRKGRIIAVTDTILDTGGTDTVRFGRMHSGEVAVLRLWIENRASKPVAITRYDRNCGCTTLGYDAQPITPGDAQQVSLTFDAGGRMGLAAQDAGHHIRRRAETPEAVHRGRSGINICVFDNISYICSVNGNKHLKHNDV